MSNNTALLRQLEIQKRELKNFYLNNSICKEDYSHQKTFIDGQIKQVMKSMNSRSRS